MKCLLDDASLSLGLVSLPLQQEPEFYQEVIKPIFERYIANVERHFTGPYDVAREDFLQLYKPHAFYLFGRFDLALLYLVDDHDFSCRTLRPFHPSADSGSEEIPDNFDYKVMFGPTPRISKPEKQSPGIIELFKRIDNYPLLALTQLKVNNSLLLGGGAAFLRLVIDYIKQESKEFEGRHHIRSIILESYAWHEITMVTLGNAYEPMLNLAARLRDASYGDVLDAALRRALDGHERADIELELSKMQHLIGPELGWSDAEVRQAPVFGNLTTSLGFDFRMFGEPKRVEQISPDDHVHVLSRWFVKPGKLADFNRLMAGGSDGLMRSVGRGDVWYPFQTAAPDAQGHVEPPKTQDSIRNYLDANRTNGLKGVALQRYTHVAIPQVQPQERGEARRFSASLRKLPFSSDELRDIDTAMRRLRIPKVLIHRLSNVYTNFNDGSLDRSLYASFAELRPFLDMVARDLKLEARLEEPSVGHEELCRLVRKWALNFERAYRNRFHNSERMGEVTDFNFEFKGGIQQVVTAFDAAYKSLSLVLGSPWSFVSVGGDPGVESSVSEVRLNYFHVFQPEMFFAIAGKEASNWFAEVHGDWFEEEEVLQLLRDHLETEENERGRDLFLEEEFDRILGHPGIEESFAEVAALTLDLPFLQTHVADLLTFHACYAGNWDLFSHWMLGAFLQVAGSYRANGVPDEYEIARFLVRLRMIAGSMSESDFRASIDAFQDDAVSEVYSIVAGQGQFETLREAIHGTHLGHWFLKVRAASERIAAFALAEPSSPQILRDVQERAQYLAGKQRDEIEKGHVPRFVPEDTYSAFRFSQQTLYGYLLLLKEKWGGKPPCLKRKKDGTPDDQTGRASLLFDPLGGVFAREAKTRRELFKYRSAVTMSLWDLGLKAKRKDLAMRMK